MSMDLVTWTVGTDIAAGNRIIQDNVREDKVTVELSGVEVWSWRLNGLELLQDCL